MNTETKVKTSTTRRNAKPRKMTWLDKQLAEMDMTRRDFDIRWTTKGGRWRIKSFTILWWVCYLGGAALAGIGFYSWYILMWLIMG